MPNIIPDGRVWTIKESDTAASKNIVTIHASEAVELATEFGEVIQQGQWLDSAISATITDSEGVPQPAVSGLGIDSTKYRVVFKPPILAVGSYTVVVKAKTTNNETLAGIGGLQVE